MDRVPSEIQLATFCLGERLFAVDIMRIREIILPQKLSPLPRASELLDGVINLRGNVVPVMNMRRRLQMSSGEDVRTGKFLLVSIERQTLALVVDDVMEVITVPSSEIKPTIQMMAGVALEFLLGVCLSNDRVFMILDIDSLLVKQELPEMPNAGIHL